MLNILKSAKILVIEPSIPVRFLIRNLLTDKGVRQIFAELDFEEGWQVYTKETPDIILVDWVNGQDSLDFIKKVRQHTASPKPETPVIIMSGFTNKERVLAARDAGASEFLIKPFTSQALSERLVYALEHPREFVISADYVGPDRRRRSNEIDPANEKRKPK